MTSTSRACCDAATGSPTTGTTRRRWSGSTKTGIDLVRGHAEFTGVKRVRVTAEDGTVTELIARHAVVVATGSAALLPDIPGLREIEPWTSRDATSAKHVPASLAVVGGGVVAAEMATAYAGFGTKVTLLVRSRLLESMEPFAGELVQASLEKLGVTVRTGVEVTAAHRTEKNAVLALSDGGRVVAEEVLVAIGRTPRTTDLGLESIGFEPGAWLAVDDTLLVKGTDWLYAVGDVNHRALLTHQGKYQARAAGDVIAARAKGLPVDDAPWGAHVATADHDHVPQVTFTDPEIASVGLTEAAARDAGRRIRVLDYDLSWIAGASTHADHYEGHGARDRRRGPRRADRRHVRRARCGRTAALGDDRDRRRGADRPAVARRAVLPDRQRGVAALARGLRPPDRLTARLASRETGIGAARQRA